DPARREQDGRTFGRRTTMTVHGGIGQSVKRKEDARFVRGKGNYVDDVKLPGMLYLDIVRSPYAHARIRYINIEKALKVPGVRAGTEKALKESDVVVHEDLYLPRIHVSSIETCGCVASFDAMGKLTVWMTTQAPHAIRTVFALVAGLPEQKIRIISRISEAG